MKVRLDDVAVVVGADATAADHLEAVLLQKFFFHQMAQKRPPLHVCLTLFIYHNTRAKSTNRLINTNVETKQRRWM